MSGVQRLTGFLVANVAAGAIALAAGWLLSDSIRIGPAPASRLIAGTVDAAFWTILANNLSVVAVMAASVCTFGTLAFFLLVLNALRAGAGLAALHQCCPASALLVWRYLPIEFTALALASGATQSLAVVWAEHLASCERSRITLHLGVFVMTALLLAVAAWVESLAFLGSA